MWESRFAINLVGWDAFGSGDGFFWGMVNTTSPGISRDTVFQHVQPRISRA